MIDFHSHILPQMDDGSHSTAESLQMLQMLSEQGVSKVVATPHFYASENTPEQFLRRRSVAWEKLSAQLSKALPDIFLGAEVCYYEGICRSKELSALCIQGTNLLLLEMPFENWSTRMLNDLLELGHRSDLRIVLAHAERYPLFKRKDVWQCVREAPILLQSNAEFFLRLRTRKMALRLLEENCIHLLGSDCHSVNHRPPQIGPAASLIQRYLDESILERMDRLACELLGTEGAKKS